MNRTYLIVPIVGVATFIGYSVYWKTHTSAGQPAITRSADPYAERSGRKEAEAEFAAGKLALIEASAPVSWDRERREIAQRSFGIELRRAPEPVTEASAKYVDAFNRFMRPRIIARHGRGVFDRIHQDAIALMDARRAQSATTGAPSARTPADPARD
jgi:hypothetical protein